MGGREGVGGSGVGGRGREGVGGGIGGLIIAEQEARQIIVLY